MSSRSSLLPAFPKTIFFSIDAEPRADPPLCAATALAVGTTAAIPAAPKNPRLVISCMVSPPVPNLYISIPRGLQGLDVYCDGFSQETNQILLMARDLVECFKRNFDFKMSFSVNYPLKPSAG